MTQQQREIILAKANALCEQGRADQAENLFLQVRHGFEGETEATAKLEKIRLAKSEESDFETYLRIIRYTFGMHSAGGRRYYWIGAVVVGVLSCYHLVASIFAGMKFGFIRDVESGIHGPVAASLYVRPLIADIVGSIFLIAVSVCAIAILVLSARKAGQWLQIARN